ncbi:hypothetical protein GQQ15_04535 [Pantoea agglomerans]|nr:hypothetical protein [Pantoea agglomerans]NEH06696.1 hypothetical protein [Pantoea agglomerans]
MARNCSGCCDTASVLKISLNTVLRHLKLSLHQLAQDIKLCAEVVTS